VIFDSIEVVLGILLVGLALRDVFDTVVVPGESRGSLRIARRLLSTMLPIWKMVCRGKTGISTGFAPSVLMASFVAWMFLLLLGFGLVAHDSATGSLRPRTVSNRRCSSPAARWRP
jgi:hypothetical protein